ncbi:MAG: DUF1156 domain-containing protein [Bacteroidetes bacterium]|nr:DUF1156 domain-containing protein [Bacteroidota bacterium]
MIPRECKRIAEVDFPIAEVSKHSAKEKSIRHGHPSTLHLWWARRPLASCRAVLIGLLLPDPCDPHCPNHFKVEARRILLNMDNRPRFWSNMIESDAGLRKVILSFIGDFANWNNATKSGYLDVSRSLIKAAHREKTPLVVDPFAGGGSIPLEALRLGCDTFASDLNPVACMILKVMLEDIPHHGPKLAEFLQEAGEQIQSQAKEELAGLYPKDEDGASAIAYLWVRTVRCESPNCGAEIPLMRSFWLCKKAKRKRALRPIIERSEGLTPSVKFEIFEPTSDKEVPLGTVTRAKATCICCGSVLHPDRVREQLRRQKGGADVIFDEEGRRIGGARMTAVVTLRAGQKGRYYRIPDDADYEAVRKSQERLDGILKEWELGGKQGLCPVPDEPLPPIGTLGFRVQRYGMMQWGDLFTARQKVALIELGKSRNSAVDIQISALTALAISKQSERLSSGCSWISVTEAPRGTFARGALPIVWDFLEMVPTAGEFHDLIKKMIKVIQLFANIQPNQGQVHIVDASKNPLPDQSSSIFFTDPPYYDAIPYSDLSDFFLVWLKRSLSNYPFLQDPFDSSNPLSPKKYEIVQDETKYDGYQSKDRDWFEDSMSKAFTEGRRILREDGVGSVVFAHKTTEGWEALLSGMIHGGWIITGSWPIATERPGRLRALESAALSTSIHLICRPRSKDAPIGDWSDVLRELPKLVSNWMSRLQNEGIRGADLVFACIGPALEIFSRYRSVETAEGNEVKLSQYLEKVWEVVGRSALEQVLNVSKMGISTTSTIEEDARLTSLFLWTVQSTDINQNDSEPTDDERILSISPKSFSLPFDVVRRFAQPMGIDLDEWTGKIISQQKGIVRLMPVMDRSKELFGEDGANQVAEWIESDIAETNQTSLFPEMTPESTSSKSRTSKSFVGKDFEFESEDATVLDRVHAAMLFQAGGQSGALRTLIASELSRGPEFLHLANALSALYPIGSQEKRLLDAMLLAVPR